MQRTAFRCGACGREFENKDMLDKHQQESHPQSRTMEGMGQQPTFSSGYEGKESLGFRCSVCKTEYESQEKLDTHLKTHQYA